ncbi:MAG: hypothetical protein HETSPECPRED_009185 [Heterodermia speciosa]|uniref:Actin-like ATPase domain-containing protein n=1 Tax=Heterodermia speciosa TaxID=116794 RepID=A0A8H3IZ53_9LECA|nr:MAG: hypothetical protein HETSPECPRED_009185 [Heterodermia speciosa]
MEKFHRIVVGIDFGTTYTAVGWADTSNPNQVEIIKNWPTAGQLVGAQAPSEIAYDEENPQEYSWGYNISPRARKVKWFKLGLEVEQEVLRLPPGLTAADVVHDYLAGIYKHIMTTLYRRFDQGVMQMTTIDFVLTVPAIWSDGAKKKTEDAAIRAGLGNEHNLQLLSEPESAAIFTLRSLENSNSYTQIRVHDRIVVCDAGGGTVDLISYDIQSIQPNLSVVECAAGTGDFCGSTFIDREFEKLFTKRMGHHYGNVSLVNRQQTVKNFESTKTAFRDDPSQKTFYVNVPTVGTLEDAGVYGGNFEITREEMRTLFDPIVDQIIQLIGLQVQTISQGSSQQQGAPVRVNAILLVGGFGESEYLYQRVQSWATQLGIQVIQPREAATAIVRGAVMKGLEPKEGPKTQIVRRARRSYGVPVDHPFIEGKHHEQDAMYQSQTGQKLARNQISWFIRKGQVMADDQTFNHRFHRPFRTLTTWRDTLVCCDSDPPPPRMQPPVQKLCAITSDLTHIKKSGAGFKRKWRGLKPYYVAEYDIEMGVRNGAQLVFGLKYREQRFGVASVEFE